GRIVGVDRHGGLVLLVLGEGRRRAPHRDEGIALGGRGYRRKGRDSSRRDDGNEHQDAFHDEIPPLGARTLGREPYPPLPKDCQTHYWGNPRWTFGRTEV